MITRGGAYPSISVEQLLALDPDVLLDGTSSDADAQGASRLAALRDAPGWRSLRAVREGACARSITDIALRPAPASATASPPSRGRSTATRWRSPTTRPSPSPGGAAGLAAPLPRTEAP